MPGLVIQIMGGDVVERLPREAGARSDKRRRNIVPIIEGKLYRWVEYLLSKNYPSPGAVRVFEGIGVRVDSSDRTSPQERWAVRRQAELIESKIIEKALKKMSSEHRRLVLLRYAENMDWWAVADRLNVERRTAYRMRDDVFAILASDLGLYKNGESG